MGAASASSQSSAMPQSQGKGGGAPMQQGGVGAPMPQGKGGGAPAQQGGSSVEDTYQQQTGHAGDAEGLAYWKGQFGDSVDPQELKTFQTSANIVNAKAGNTQPVAQGTGKGGGAQGSPQGGPALPNAGQQGWQYGQGASGNRVTYPSTSDQQQFGQPMQNSAFTPYSNTIRQGQQSNQMGSSGKGKGA